MHAPVTVLLSALALVGTLLVPRGGHARAISSNESPAPTTTTSEPPALLDDPFNSSATSGYENTDDPASDDICVRCYDKVKHSQDMVDIYEALSRKQRKLINRKKAAAEVAEAARSSPAADSSARPNKPNRSAVRSLTWPTSGQSEPIVISTLRVARSPAADESTAWSQAAPQASSNYRPLNKDKYANLNKKDVDLERLKREMERQKEATCKVLLDLRDCLEQVNLECIGNLHFHTYEIFTDQWYGKLRCPYPNNPKIKPLPNLRSTVDLESTRTPVVRPISTPEVIRERLNGMLPNKTFPHPLGVMLKPTLSNLAIVKQQPFADQRQSLQSQQQSQVGAYQGSMRDFSGHHFGRDFAGKLQQQSVDDQSLNMVNVGKILLVPVVLQ